MGRLYQFSGRAFELDELCHSARGTDVRESRLSQELWNGCVEASVIISKPLSPSDIEMLAVFRVDDVNEILADMAWVYPACQFCCDRGSEDESASLGRDDGGDSQRRTETCFDGVGLDEGGRLRDAREKRVGARGERDKVNAERNDAMAWVGQWCRRGYIARLSGRPSRPRRKTHHYL